MDHTLDGPVWQEWFAERFDYRFQDPELLRCALTHRSVAQDDPEHPEPLRTEEHNERLEFLGDAVLDLAVSELLYHRHPHASEGDLSHWRALLVNTHALGSLGVELGVGAHVRLGRGEELSRGREKPSIVGNSMEALLGAVFLDGGWSGVTQVARCLFGERMERFAPGGERKDFKTALQERLQGMGRPLPRYLLVEMSGAAHERHFAVECQVTDEPELAGRGTGSSKRRAEQEAARTLLTLLDRSCNKESLD
ncbi:MAG: ribonuclease III [Magnetococcales bacterium]|nr:ribonuclease III [Magnetococcales bacterium]